MRPLAASRAACQHLLRVQKALDQMNIQLHHAVTGITGQIGLAILDAILAGERDAEALAQLRHFRCMKSEAEIARALRDDWREEHLFTLRQSLEAWRFHQRLMADCDRQIAEHLSALDDRWQGSAPPTAKKGAKALEEPMRQQLFEKFGVDLTAVEGVRIRTVLAFLGEVGTDASRFASAEHFGSWLGLCPDNRITGGRTHAAHTRKVNNRLATALRMAAQSLHRSQSALGDWFRRLKAKLDTTAAVTAAAHSRAERDSQSAESLPEGHRRMAAATWPASSGRWSNTVVPTAPAVLETRNGSAPARNATCADKPRNSDSP